MTLRRFEAADARIYDAPRELVWALVSDTNRSDRALGLAAATYRWDEDPETGQQVRIASARELGQPLEWIEPPYEWVEGRFVRGRRTFIQGPVAEGWFSAELEDADEGTRLTARAGLSARGVVAFALGPVQRAKFRRNLRRYLDALDEVLAGWREVDLGPRTQPAAVRAQRLLAGTDEAITTGPRTPCDAAVLQARAQRLKAAPVDSDAREQLIRQLRERPDDEVSQMRPFELAGTWGLSRAEVLRAFLHATEAGLTDLRWQVNCPVCRVGASVVSDLSEVGETSHCAACQIHYDTDFAKHVEAVFPVNEAVRPVRPQLYCASSPAFLPHVVAQVRVDAGETRALPIDLPVGELLVRALGRAGGADAEADVEGSSLRVRVDGDALAAEPTPDGEGALTLVNDGPEARVILVERAGWSADAVLGTVMSSFPEFLNLFATEAPAAGVDLRVGHLALLFSDLVGSTALYERVGDARAYALVEEHFGLARRAVAEAGGAIVKTMGDAVMGSFPSVREAVGAATAMIAAHDAAHPDGELGVKVGVHGGPCLAVRANERLDYFGTTVNLAARLQAQAAASEIVLTEETYADPTVKPLLEGLPVRTFSAALKGIRSEQTLVGVDCRPLADEP
ncbi:MAG TPA: adenylate/guanylate cyclase domain-containing protein [Sandaracinaceae bacterium LLY-WYZ-13_1]|nr:adenylate/guanylate cyclase domain-containing protein [Sandaracinaceae bacterium LLY-WYZ-13_1]